MKSFENEIGLACKMPPELQDESTSKSTCEKILKTRLHQANQQDYFDAVSVIDLKMLYVVASKLDLEDVACGYADVISDALTSQGRPVLTQMGYEDLVLNNPAQSMRTYTTGAVGQSEACFYRGHQIIEGAMNKAIIAMKSAYVTGDTGFLVDAHENITDAANTMVKFRTELSKDHFNDFRRFFATNRYTGEKGPSGAFSATIPHVDVLLGGYDDYANKDYVEGHRQYFPQNDLAALDQSVQDGINLTERFAKNADALPLLQSIAQRMVSFRKLHEGSVRAHIGTNIIGSAENDNSMRFLTDRVESSVRRVKTINPFP